jgi:hypothetical protein
MSEVTHEALRDLLCQLGLACRNAVLAGRRGVDFVTLARVDGQGGGDTIYAVDRIGEGAILEWFRTQWPKCFPVQIVMEGLVGETCFPEGLQAAETDWKCIIDPIDGTRGIMYDKRSAWSLSGIAPQSGSDTMLSQIVAAAMTEIPTTRQWRADQFSTTRGGGVVGASEDVRSGGTISIDPAPSQANGFAHGFASLVKFFPEGRTLTAQIEERLWDELIGLNSSPSPVIFDDQYICTGGQFYELISGHDRMVGDLRPLIFRTLDLETSLVCHPYDCCSALVLQQSGVVFEHPLGGFPDAPLDTESGVSWMAYANETLAAQARPVLSRILEQFLA